MKHSGFCVRFPVRNITGETSPCGTTVTVLEPVERAKFFLPLTFSTVPTTTRRRLPSITNRPRGNLLVPLDERLPAFLVLFMSIFFLPIDPPISPMVANAKTIFAPGYATFLRCAVETCISS